jgi:hypothetical protein
MTLANPSVRAFSLDDKTGSPSAIIGSIIGSISGAAAIERKIQEITGPSNTEPVKFPTGFERYANLKISVRVDPGGSPDLWDDLYINRKLPTATLGTRTCVITFYTGKTCTGEVFIAKCEPGLPVEEFATLDVELEWAGVMTPA